MSGTKGARRRGRLTPGRRLVLNILHDAGRPLSAYAILDELRHRLPGAAAPTVYRALDFLMGQGLAHRIESLHAFVHCARPEAPHHGPFLICRDCGSVRELEDAGLDARLRSTGEGNGFRTCHAVVELLGTCAHCATPTRRGGPAQEAGGRKD